MRRRIRRHDHPFSVTDLTTSFVCGPTPVTSLPPAAWRSRSTTPAACVRSTSIPTPITGKQPIQRRPFRCRRIRRASVPHLTRSVARASANRRLPMTTRHAASPDLARRCVDQVRDRTESVGCRRAGRQSRSHRPRRDRANLSNRPHTAQPVCSCAGPLPEIAGKPLKEPPTRERLQKVSPPILVVTMQHASRHTNTTKETIPMRPILRTLAVAASLSCALAAHPLSPTTAARSRSWSAGSRS